MKPYEQGLCRTCPFCIEKPNESPLCCESQDMWGDDVLCAYKDTCGQQEMRFCPRCKKYYTEKPALSRKDNQTEICPECGAAEAIEALIEYQNGGAEQ